MPRFTKSCHNPLHHEWITDTIEEKIICLRANGLGEVANIYKTVETEEGGRRQSITNSCSQCLIQFCRKGALSDELMQNITSTLIDKVGIIFLVYLTLHCY